MEASASSQRHELSTDRSTCERVSINACNSHYAYSSGSSSSAIHKEARSINTVSWDDHCLSFCQPKLIVDMLSPPGLYQAWQLVIRFEQICSQHACTANRDNATHPAHRRARIAAVLQEITRTENACEKRNK